MAHRAELAGILEERLAAATTDEWVALLLDAGVPAGPIRDYAYVLDEDPHVRARGMIRRSIIRSRGRSGCWDRRLG